MLTILVIYLTVGVVVGILAGIFGVGGGIIVVPALIFCFRRMGMDESYLVHMAIATSHTTIIFTSATSSFAYHKRKNVEWPVVRYLAPGLLIGALIFGPYIADYLPSTVLQTIFAVFLLFVATKMLLGLNPKSAGQVPGAAKLGLVGGCIGTLSSLLGIGGGSITVPFLSWKGMSMRHAVGTSVSCGVLIAVSSSIGYIYAGWGEVNLPEETLGYVYWPALLGIVTTSMLFVRVGIKIASLIDDKLQKKLFAILLFAVAIKMLIY